MAFSEERCRHHADSVANLQKTVYGTDGGKGLKERLEALEFWHVQVSKEQERNERRSDSVRTLLLAQLIGHVIELVILIFVILKVIIK